MNNYYYVYYATYIAIMIIGCNKLIHSDIFVKILVLVEKSIFDIRLLSTVGNNLIYLQVVLY